jgi:hypothetical protein
MEAVPEMLAHSPVLLRKARLISECSWRSSVLPDSVLVWKMKSMPLSSCVVGLVNVRAILKIVWKAHPCGDGHASASKKTILGLGGHHAELALVDESLQVLDLLLEGGVLEVLCGVRVGGLAAGVGVGEGRHSEGLFVD